MSGLTYEQAVQQLSALSDSGKLTPATLLNLIGEISVDGSAAPGSVTVLYSGGIGNDLSANGMVEAMAAQGDPIRIINTTDTAKFLNLETGPLKPLLAEMFGVDINTIGKSAFGSNAANQFLFAPGTGAWARGSVHLATTASGNILTISPLSSATRVLAVDELPTILANKNVTSINGIPKSVFQGILDSGGTLADVNEAVGSRKATV